MNRYYNWFETVTPEEFPEAFRKSTAESNPDHDTRPQAPWTESDIYAYKVALRELGFSPAQIAMQLEKDCGVKIDVTPAESPMLPGALTRRQAN